MFHKLSELRERGERRRRHGRFALYLAAFLLLSGATWLAGGATGLWSLAVGLRWEQWSTGPENWYGISAWRQGGSLGLETFYFREGQRIYVDYEVSVYSGGFAFHVYQLPLYGKLDVISHKIDRSHKARVYGTIPEDGFYRFGHYTTSEFNGKISELESIYWVSWGVAD